jgi:sulfate permease, SulP family
MLAFAPFGPAYVANGMVAGIASSAVAGIANALVGGTPLQINGPRGSVAVLMAGLITAITVHPALATGDAPDVPKILGITMLCIGLSGLLQVAFGLLHFGAAIRFLPYPVISGFMVALGLLVVWPQIPAFLGASPGIGWEALMRELNLRWGAIAVGATTICCFTLSRKKFPKSPAPLIGILAGTALHYLLLQAFGKDVIGFTGFDTLADGAYPPHPWQLPEFTLDRTVLGVVASLLPAIAIIAFIGSIESLLSSSVVSIASQMRFDSNRELIAQGLSNMAVAAIGGAVSCGAPFRGVVNYAAGGRTRLSGALHSVMAIPLLFALPVLLFIPIAVLAGVLIVAGWDVATTWYKRLVACPRQDLAVGCLVMAATLLMGTAPAILFGIVGAMFLYVRNTSRAPLGGHYDGTLRQSTRIRPEEQVAYLRSLGPAIRIVDVQGALFFGTADRFGRDIEELADGCRHLILNMRRVNEVDPTGAHVLVQTMRRLDERGIRTAIAAVAIADRRGTVMARAGLDKVVPPERWFEDADRALERAEDIELENRWPDRQSGAELPLSAMEVCSGMSAPQIETLEQHLQRIALPAGSALFREGDAGDRLYLLARGEITVSIKLHGEVAGNYRLGTYCPGVVLGEMAVLEQKPRSADAVVVSDCVLYTLDGAALERMRLENPAVHSQFMLNITRQAIGRLRSRTLELRAAYS